MIDAPIQPGMLVEIAPGLRRLTANNPSSMTGPGTNSYIVGREACLIVDPGVDDEAHLEALMAACDANVCGICLTHRHPDHVGGTARLAQWTGAPVLAWPKPELSSHDKAVHVNHELSDHELLGDGLLKVHHTPGHAADHVAFEWLDQGILLAGDALMTDATVVILPPDGNMGAYFATLERLETLAPRMVAPAHGQIIVQPTREIDDVRRHRRQREAQVRVMLSRQQPLTPECIARSLYPELSGHLGRMAAMQVRAHLEHLAQVGQASCVNGMWVLS